MAICEGTVLAGTMAAALWVGPSQPAAAQGARLAMRIVVYDYAHVRPDLLAQAKMVVSRIFASIDVDAVWMEVAEFTREMPSENADRRAFVDSVVQVNVISPDMHKMLGRKSSVLGGAGSRTRRVWVAFSRIQQSARLAKADVSDALGSVIAHEIGHVLMPTGVHALTGLMQHGVDANLIAQNRAFFLSEEATLIRATLAGDASASLKQDGAAAVRIPPWPCRLIVRSTLLEVVEDGWHRSETLRRQCRELADARAIVVLEWHTVFESQSRAMTRIGTDPKAIVVAAVSVPPVSHALELVAHELEHVLEQTRGLDLAAESRRHGSGVWKAFGGFESQRAIDIGRRVSAEIEESRRMR